MCQRSHKGAEEEDQACQDQIQGQNGEFTSGDVRDAWKSLNTMIGRTRVYCLMFRQIEQNIQWLD